MTQLVQGWNIVAQDMKSRTQAKQLGSLSQGVELARGLENGLNLWSQLLSSMRERYSLKDGLIVQRDKWNTMKQGIQNLS